MGAREWGESGAEGGSRERTRGRENRGSNIAQVTHQVIGERERLFITSCCRPRQGRERVGSAPVISHRRQESLLSAATALDPLTGSDEEPSTADPVSSAVRLPPSHASAGFQREISLRVYACVCSWTRNLDAERFTSLTPSLARWMRQITLLPLSLSLCLRIPAS